MAMNRSWSLVLLCSALLFGQTLAGDDEWLSPVYTQFFQNPLPFPPDKPIK